MSRQRFMLLLIASLVAISGALWLATQRNASHETPGGALFPSLAAGLDAVTEVSVGNGGDAPKSTLQKSAAGWILQERGGYPVDVAKLRKLLGALSDAKIVEKKTADSARYAIIGVEDPSQPGATGTEVSVLTAAARQTVIIGKAAGEGSFVRRPGEQQSYSVEPGIPVEAEPHFWIDSRLLDVPPAQIRRVEFRPAAGPAYAVQRSSADGPFSLDGVPAGRTAVAADGLAPAATTFTGLTAEDVAALEGVDFSRPVTTILTLVDGDVITLTGSVAGTRHWLQITSAKNAVLTARAQGRAFEVASYRYDAIFKPLEQLLLPKESPAARATPAPPAHAPKKN